MDKPTYHIFVCAGFRAGGNPQGNCGKKNAAAFLPYIENEILDRGMDAQVTAAGCMKACDYGPVMVVYPPGFWYGRVDGEAAIDTILDTLEDGGAAAAHLID